ncbi:hypothetical protein DV532_12125 [Pseudomonas sp. Leaf58]|nr:hypothetical protein DV532_12125 [Pseudomonas sp. Leaf58]
MPAKHPARCLAPAAPVFAGKPAPTISTGQARRLSASARCRCYARNRRGPGPGWGCRSSR